MRCKFQHIEGQFHIHIALNAALACFRIGKFARQFADNRKAVIVQPVNQRAERRKFLIFGECGVIIGTDQINISAKKTVQFGIINIHIQRTRGGIKIGSVNEKGGFLFRHDNVRINKIIYSLYHRGCCSQIPAFYMGPDTI